MTQLTSLSEGVRTLSESLAQTTTLASQSSARVKRQLDELKPRLAAVGSEAITLTSAVGAALQSGRATDLLEERLQGLCQALDELEKETLPQKVESGAAEVVGSLSRYVGDLERRIATFSTSTRTMGGTIQRARSRRAEMDRKLNDLSTSLMNTIEKVGAETSTLNQRLTALENCLEKLYTEISKALERKTAGKFGESDVQYLADALSDIRDASRTYLQNRRDEWRQFDEANAKTDELIKRELVRLDAEVNAGSAVARIAAAERRIRWCLDRIAAWRRDEQPFGGSLDAQLTDCEQCILGGLTRLGDHPAPFESIKKSPIVPIRAKPAGPEAKEIEPIVIPPESRFTYKGEDIDDFPPPKGIARRPTDTEAPLLTDVMGSVPLGTIQGEK
jgi:chromosome segregation ATPase